MVKEGEYVYIIAESRGRVKEYFFKLDPKNTYFTIAGLIKGEEILNLDWGAVLNLQAGKAYILQPTRHEMMKYALDRVGQVIYPKDLGYMIESSGIMPGMRVLEAGVGSGFLTAALAIAVGERGKVIGYDVRKEAVEVTEKNLKRLGLFERVDLRIGDIRKGVYDKDLDALFLDMPDPWLALEAVHKNLKGGAPVVVFVPTVNQIEKVYANVVAKGLYVIQEASEVLKRELEIRPGAIRPKTRMIGHTGYILLLRKISES